MNKSTEKRKNYGFSLIEVILAIGLGGIVIILTSSLSKRLLVSDKNSNDSQISLNYLHLIKTALNISSNSLVPQLFDPTVSYAGMNISQLNRANFTPRNKKIISFKHQGIDYTISRGSSTIEMANSDDKIKGITRGVMVARCIDKSQVKREDWSVNEIMNLSHFPLPSVDQDDNPTLKCCELGSSNLSSCDIADKKSNWRSRVFKISQNAILVWPEPSVSPLIGAAFFRFFSDPESYGLMTVNALIMSNKCMHAIDYDDSDSYSYDNCPAIKFEGQSESHPMELDFYDAGVINLGQ